MTNETFTIEDQREKSGFTYHEDVAPGLTTTMSLKKILISTNSEFQKIDIIESYFGKHLVTDGKTQSTQFDEFAYHGVYATITSIKTLCLFLTTKTKVLCLTKIFKN